ncbi:helix-turn-helix domain-containing protein [Photorhabdus sp. RM71S]|uniref:helix-turn-helix domain-containing protein n=1 Tax=Photorhabdus sp. RM71S TaxID=3342824 RepID=UPI0036D91CE3
MEKINTLFIFTSVYIGEQKAELEHLHHTCRDKRECDRIKAVLLSSEGWSSVMIAQALRLHETTINRHISDDLNHRKLKPENGGFQSYLSETQTQELIAYLTANLLPTTHRGGYPPCRRMVGYQLHRSRHQ